MLEIYGSDIGQESRFVAEHAAVCRYLLECSCVQVREDGLGV